MATTTLSEAPAIIPEHDETSADLATSEPLLLGIRRRITVEEYHRIIDAGILGDEPRVELLEGIIVNKMGKNPPHVIVAILIQRLLHILLPVGSGFYISTDNPLTIEDRDGEPEPDLMVIRGDPRDYVGKRQSPADAAMVVELSDTSYSEDRSVKRSLYAAARVPIYWIVDIKRNRLEIHGEPTGEGESASYARETVLGPDDEVPLVLDGREIARFPLREILP